MNKKTTYSTPLLNVQDAAELLGVNAGTIRRWVHNKQIKGVKVGIRGDWRFTKEDVLKMVNQNQIEQTSPSLLLRESAVEFNLAPQSDWKQTNDYQHFVQFYENDVFLVNSVSEFISSGDAAIVVATAAHREKLDEALKAHWPDLEMVKARGRYISLDAYETLSKFMVNGLPDPGGFFEVIGNLIMRTTRNGRRVRIFGEMVALLWSEGNKEGAIKLEELWNDLQKNHFFSLYCAYPMYGFGGEEHAVPFAEMNKLHSHVIPAESYNALKDVEERLREIASLQQQAKTLKDEITKRKKTEQRLKLSELRYRRLFESSKDGVLIIDFETQKILDANPFMEELLGINREELMNKTFSETVLVPHGETAADLFTKLQTNHVIRYDLKVINIHGEEREIEVVAIIYKEDEKLRVQCDMRDITERKRIERQKDEFMSIVSHELKTPITSLKAYAQVLQNKFVKAGDMQTAQHFGKMDGQINKLTGLIGDLLDIAILQGEKMQFNEAAFTFDELVSEVIEEVQRTTEKHKIVKKGKTSLQLYGDRDRMGQVITNLLTNAIKYSPDSKDVIVTLSADKKQITLSVQDFGIGISKDEQQYIFDRFYRESGSSKATFPGLGLGLYITSKIVSRHHGKIWVESEKGKGSTFFVSLPLKN